MARSPRNDRVGAISCTKPLRRSFQKEADSSEQKDKDREKRLKLQLDLRNAKLELDRIKEVIDEPKTYADLPEETRDRMIRKIYISSGKYTVDIKSGENTDSAMLEVK